MYSVDFTLLINWLLPSSLRKSGQLAWINALLAPVKWLHTRFESFVTSTRYDLQITGQVRSLEYHLNRVFFPAFGANSIYITDGDSGSLVYIFLESENNPVYLPQFISGGSSDFVVHCHKSILANDHAIRAFIDRYKLPSKTYTIIYFT